jgi:outer membrane receptor protein involved in Fe transport
MLMMNMFLWTAVCLLAQAQATAVLTGRVIDSAKSVLPGAEIILRGTAADSERTTKADAGGNFQIENLAPGSYRLIVRNPGLAEKSQEITLTSGQRLSLQVVLNPPQMAESIEVVEKISEIPTTAAKTDTPLIETPQSISIVTRDNLVVQAPLTLQEALRYTAGVRTEAYGLDSRGD